MNNPLHKWLFTFAVALVFFSCDTSPKSPEHPAVSMAQHEKQWTGIGISSDDRIFVNFPTWSDDVPIKVGEINNGTTLPYPDADQSGFVAVQSVVVDALDRLWILDTNNPQFSGVLEEGPMLHAFDLKADTLLRTFHFPKGIYHPNSYFNDVRVDTDKEIAYMTDSGRGGLIVLDLSNGHSARVLDDQHSTQAEVDHLICDGHKWTNTVHSDGIALSPDKDWLYFIALSGHSLYRVATNELQEALSNNISPTPELVREIPATDGMLFDRQGGLWLGGLENNAINYLQKNGELCEAARGATIRWADSFARDASGNIYFTTSQIHLPEESRAEYEILKLETASLEMKALDFK